jgi:hypothetical protein
MDPGVAGIIVALIGGVATVAVAVITTRAKEREGAAPVSSCQSLA